MTLDGKSLSCWRHIGVRATRHPAVFTAKILPVRILYPSLNYRFITEIIGTLEIMKSHCQAGGLGRSAEAWVIEFAEGSVKRKPDGEFASLYKGCCSFSICSNLEVNNIARELLCCLGCIKTSMFCKEINNKNHFLAI